MHKHLSPRFHAYCDIEKSKYPKGKQPTDSAIANQMLEKLINLEVINTKTFPYLRYLTLDDNDSIIHVKDTRDQKVYSVFKYDHRLKCREDDSINCDHAIFSGHVPEAVRLFEDSETLEQLLKPEPKQSSQRVK